MIKSSTGILGLKVIAQELQFIQLQGLVLQYMGALTVKGLVHSVMLSALRTTRC